MTKPLRVVRSATIGNTALLTATVVAVHLLTNFNLGEGIAVSPGTAIVGLAEPLRVVRSVAVGNSTVAGSTGLSHGNLYPTYMGKGRAGVAPGPVGLLVGGKFRHKGNGRKYRIKATLDTGNALT